MLVFKNKDNDGHVYYTQISTEKTLDEYVSMNAKLYNKVDDDFILWFDGYNWIFPRPVLEEEYTASLVTSDLMNVLNEINSKLDRL